MLSRVSPTYNVHFASRLGLIAAFALLSACSSGEQIRVSINPASATVMRGTTQQFTASVTGTADIAVIWSIDEGSSGGTISDNGLYAPPTGSSANGTFHVVASSHADSKRAAKAQVTVPVIAVAVSPNSVTIPPASFVQFASTVTGTTDGSVTWSVWEGTIGGSIDNAGKYTAPDSPGTYHVVARSNADPSIAGNATVTVGTGCACCFRAHPFQESFAGYQYGASPAGAKASSIATDWRQINAYTQTITHFSEWSEPANVGPVVNYRGATTRGATIAPNGLSLYLVTNRPGGVGDLDLWVSQRPSVDGEWGAPQNLGPLINSSYLEANPSFSPDGMRLFFNSDRPGGCGGQDLWVATRMEADDDFGWGEPMNLGCGINGEFRDQGPAFLAASENGSETLFFGSDRPGGRGVRNIYSSALLEDGSWGSPTLVAELNSPYMDARPSVTSDGLELYFTSNRPGGSGDPKILDTWVSTRASSQEAWSAPVPVFLDFRFASISTDGTLMFMVRQQPGSDYGDMFQDIYVSTRHGVR
jgi:hypothetical protein